MRILFVHSGSDVYGASRSLLRLTSRLAADGHGVMAVLPNDGPLVTALETVGVETAFDDRMVIVTRKNIAGHRGYGRQLLDMPRSVGRLVRCVRRFRPDVVHTNTSVVISSALAATICGLPHVWHIREFYVDFPSLWPYHRAFMTRTADRVLCVSGAVAEQFGAEARNVQVLHNGFPASEFAPVSQARIDAFLARFGVERGPRVGIVGRIKFKRKGQETFVRAAALLARSYPDVHFLVIGSPFPGNEDHLSRLKTLISELGVEDRIILTGDVEDIKAAYAALDVAVLASSSPEPFGGVVIEAMAMGRPVIGTRVGGTTEQITDGVTGALVAPDDPRAMASALEPLLVDEQLRVRMGNAARERFISTFEFEPFYARMMGVYRDVLAGRTT